MAPPNSPMPLYDVTRTGFGEPFQLPETAEYHSYISAAVYNIAMAGLVCDAQQVTQHIANNADIHKYMDNARRDIPAGLRKIKYAKVYPSFDYGEKLLKTDSEIQQLARLFCVEPDTRFEQNKEVSSTNNNALQANILDVNQRQENGINRFMSRMQVSFRKSRKVWPCSTGSDQPEPMSKERMEKIASMFCVETTVDVDIRKKSPVYCGETEGDKDKTVHKISKPGKRNHVSVFLQGLKSLFTRS